MKECKHSKDYTQKIKTKAANLSINGSVILLLKVVLDFQFLSISAI